MTKIAIAALDAGGLEAQVSPHFGRCPYFTVVEVDDQEVCAVENVTNPHYPTHDPGQIPGFINSLGVDAILSGGMGGRAVAFFRQYGIEPATGASGTVREALTRYLGGSLSGAAPCAESVEHGHG
jgi:predicted Fe-Mo cluster-binding NifX family protein